MRRPQLTAVTVSCLAAGMSFGCGQSASDGLETVEHASQAVTTTTALPRAEYHLALNYPKGVKPMETAVAASGVLNIGSFAKVLATSGYAAISNMGTGTTTIEADGAVGAARSLSKLILRDRAHVNGELVALALERGNNTVVTGTISSDVSKLQPPSSVTLDVVFPAANASAVWLEPSQTQAAPPGRYTTLRAANAATVKLRSGVYYVDVIQFESGSKLQLDQSGGPVVIYVQTQLTWRGSVVEASGKTPDMVMAYVGTQNVSVETPFRGALFAPAASLAFQGTPGEHRGMFFGRDVTVSANQKITLTPTKAALWTMDSRTCLTHVPPRSDLTGYNREVAFQRDMQQYCLGRDESQGLNQVRAIATVDRVKAAAQVTVGISEPNVYMGVRDDRARKVKRAQTDDAYAQAIAAGLDQDHDLIPDADDTCHDTPLLTPTDDHGCPTPLPNGPSGTQVRQLIGTHRVMLNNSCPTGMVPELTTPGAFFWPSDSSKGVFWVTSRAVGQDPACAVWYEIEIKGETQDGQPAHLRVIFAESERQTTNLVGIPNRPVGADYAQFQVTPSNTGVRGKLANDLKPYRGQFRARAFNSAGVQGTWTDWRSQTNRDCLSLGFSCGG